MSPSTGDFSRYRREKGNTLIGNRGARQAGTMITQGTSAFAFDTLDFSLGGASLREEG